MFSGDVKALTKLKVLWLKSDLQFLKVTCSKIPPLGFERLILKRVKLVNESGGNLFNQILNIQHLSLKNCSFGKIDIDSFENLTQLKSLFMSFSAEHFRVICQFPTFCERLEEVEIKSCDINESIQIFLERSQKLDHCILNKLYLHTEMAKSIQIKFPLSLRKLEIVH
mmetsp:Transcript_1093/g.973  ORF Transcript_1093/g.973 Transcript_1093/m.973 type:complete len:168 (+) Transcript_1093:1526-2029(+)